MLGDGSDRRGEKRWIPSLWLLFVLGSVGTVCPLVAFHLERGRGISSWFLTALLVLFFAGIFTWAIAAILIFRRSGVVLRRAQESTRQSESLLQAILDNLADGVTVVDKDGRFTYFNPAAERILGIGRTDSSPDQWQEVYGTYHPDTLTPLHAEEMPLVRALSGVETRDVEMLIRNPRIPRGVVISVTGSAIRDAEGGIVGAVVVFHDITERKEAEEELRRINAFLDSIVENIPDMLFLKDSHDLRFVRFNRAGEELLGFQRDELIGKNDFDLFPEEQARFFTEKDRQVLEHRKLEDIPEEPILTRYKGERILHTKKIPILDARGVPQFLLGISADITESKRLEEAERVRDLARHLQYAREEERNRIAREIHDELGQALTGLKYELSWIARQAGTNPERLPGRLRDVERMIDDTIRSVRRIVAELRPHLLDHFGLLEALGWEAQCFEERTGIRCDLTLPDQTIAWDEERSTAMFRIFQETLTNVARHSGASRVTAEVTRREGHVELQVRDDGRGITDAEVASPRSFGLIGMVERVRMFGGTLEIGGTDGRGTTVKVRIPV